MPETLKEWIDVKTELPKTEGIVWVKRSSSPLYPELAYYRDSKHISYRFQDPLAVEDYEGLSVEYYTDVTHWMELECQKP